MISPQNTVFIIHSSMTISQHSHDKNNILLFTTRLSLNLLEFWSDDYNFECSLRLLNDLKLQQKISEMRLHHQKYKALLTLLFTRYVINQLLGSNNFFDVVNFSYNEYGKPMLPDFQFNSSSSNDIICMVVEYSSHPIGVDLSHSRQKVSPVNYLEEFRPIFDKHEILQVDTYFKFNHFWTLKEAFTKLIGSGLNIELSDFYFEVGQGFSEEDYEYIQTQDTSDCYDYSLSWFDNINVNIEKLKAKKDQFIGNLEKEEFYCFSSILENSSGDQPPVIVTIVTQNESKPIKPIEVQFDKILLGYF